MKTKLKLLLLAVGVACTGLLTQCVKNEESEGVRAVRESYAERLSGEADYQRALADKVRAEAEYQRAQTEWEKVYNEYVNELKRIEVALAEADLAQRQAELEAELQEAKNHLLAAQHDYAEALINNEIALIEANKALAEARAKILSEDPALVEYLALKDQLYNAANGLYYVKKGKVTKKLEKEGDLIELRYAVRGEWLRWMERDSIKKATDLEYTLKLLDKYEKLNGLSVTELQAKAGDAKIDWNVAQTEAQDLKVVKTEKENDLDAEKYTLKVENDKLNVAKNKLSGDAVKEALVDSLYGVSLPASAYPTIYPAPLANLITDIFDDDVEGAENILKFAAARLAFLLSPSTASQSDGFSNHGNVIPGDANPNRKYLEDKITHIQSNLLPAITTEIQDKEKVIAETQVEFDADTVTWRSAKETYLATVESVNAATGALRSQLKTWQITLDDINDQNKPDVTDLTEGQKSSIFTAIKNYYTVRYRFDQKESNVANVPTTLADLNDASKFTKDIFFGTVGVSSYQAYIDNFKKDSDIKIVSNYDWRNFENNGDASDWATVTVTFLSELPLNTSSPDYGYGNTAIGRYLYYSKKIYGASVLSDVHYYIPYEKRPEQKAPDVPVAPVLGNYENALIGALIKARTTLAELEANAANEFYLENYKTALALLNRTIVYYDNMKTKYEARVAEIKKEIEAQAQVVAAQQLKVDAAQLLVDEAEIRYTRADNYAGYLENIYNELKDATSTTLGIIKAAIKELEDKIKDELIPAVKTANEALREYKVKGDKTPDYIAALIADLELEIAALKGEIAVLEEAIAVIEARMDALLAGI